MAVIMKFDFLKRILCPPSYMTMPFAGIEIGNEHIRYIEFKTIDGEIRLANFGSYNMPEGTFKDGQISNKEALVKSLTIVKSKISTTFVKVAIPEERSYIFNTRIPLLPSKEMRQALEFRLEENVPLKISEASFEYELVGDNKAETNDSIVSVSVIPKQVIEEYVNIFNSVGLDIVSCETESKMVAKTLLPRHNRDSVMIINIKGSSTRISVVFCGAVWFTSNVPIGNKAITEALKKTSVIKDGDTDEIPENILSERMSPNDILNSLTNVYSVISEEADKLGKYWLTESEKQHLSDAGKFDRIVLCGRCAMLPELANYISQNTGIRTVVGDVWRNTLDTDAFLPDLNFADSLDYAVAIGLATPCN